MGMRNLLAASLVLLAAPLANAGDAKPAPMQQHMQEMQRSMDGIQMLEHQAQMKD